MKIAWILVSCLALAFGLPIPKLRWTPPLPSSPTLLKELTLPPLPLTRKTLRPRTPFFGFPFRYYSPGAVRTPVLHYSPYRGYYKKGRRRSEGSRYIDRDIPSNGNTRIINKGGGRRASSYYTPTTTSSSSMGMISITTGRDTTRGRQPLVAVNTLQKRKVVTITEYPVETRVETIKVPKSMRSTVTNTKMVTVTATASLENSRMLNAITTTTTTTTTIVLNTKKKNSTSSSGTHANVTPKPTVPPSPSPSPSILPSSLSFLRPPTRYFEPPGITPCPCPSVASQMQLTNEPLPLPQPEKKKLKKREGVVLWRLESLFHRLLSYINPQRSPHPQLPNSPPGKRNEDPGRKIELEKKPTCPCLNPGNELPDIRDDKRKLPAHPYYRKRVVKREMDSDFVPRRGGGGDDFVNLLRFGNGDMIRMG
ncbi:uncharacterized protein DFL_008146 [Arthrobotrys flagrans]|uniref:Uncharacterized protein n=1 Tax=Arthrobotrys flagrans TaxID=97331 RepID=A0A436ZN01_ARTFL|nr:hypothetical protein DFL_008146 [Arthrobotrys flagrans]